MVDFIKNKKMKNLKAFILGVFLTMAIGLSYATYMPNLSSMVISAVTIGQSKSQLNASYPNAVR